MKNIKTGYMKKLKFLLALVFTSLIIVSCGPGKHVTNNDNVYGITRMYYVINTTYGISQLDSLIRADRLAPLDTWYYSPLMSPEGRINQWLYIKSLDRNHESIYTATQLSVDTLFKCTKRITEEIK